MAVVTRRLTENSGSFMAGSLLDLDGRAFDQAEVALDDDRDRLPSRPSRISIIVVFLRPRVTSRLTALPFSARKTYLFVEDRLLGHDQGVLGGTGLRRRPCRRFPAGAPSRGWPASTSTRNFLASASAVRLTTEIVPGKSLVSPSPTRSDRGLALLQAADVARGDLHDDLDPGIVHQGDDPGRRPVAAHHRIDDVADLGVLGSDDPGPGRLHDGVVQGVAGQVDAGPGLLELGLGRVEAQLDLLVLLLGDGLLGLAAGPCAPWSRAALS